MIEHVNDLPLIRIKSSGQNDTPEYSRYEYEGMVPIADDQGRQVPDQKSQRQIPPAPVLIQRVAMPCLEVPARGRC